jgi:hypothetical protein
MANNGTVPPTTSAERPQAQETAAAQGGRKLVYTMLSGQLLCNFSIRYMLAPLTSVFIAAEAGYTESQQAALLGAFFPGYMLTQFPAGDSGWQGCPHR